MAPALRSMPVPPPQPSPPAELSDDEEDGDRHDRHWPACDGQHAGQPGRAATETAARRLGRVHRGRHHSSSSGSAAGHTHSTHTPPPAALGALDDMGSSGSRQQPGKPGHGQQGLLGRRTQSSGSLCTGEKLGRLLAPCGRHRHRGNHFNHNDYNCSHHHNHAGDDCHRHLRYKLCGSLPNHLDAAQRDACDNNNITPASPCVSEKDLLDLGYASERSPDDEKHFPGDMSGACESVPLHRGSRGLGFSVCGGADCSSDGLVRIKRLFPHQPAWQSGRLRPGDVLLAVNGEPLSGLTNHEALEVLRTATDHVVLTVARPSRPPSWAHASLAMQAGMQPRQPPQCLQLPDPRLSRQDSCGELEVALSKVQGSLGFTLRKEDSSVLGHYVRALVREPAISDGRIRPGDKIVAVNGVDICHMTHEEAVLFLRQAGDTVLLRLYRDVAQTPVSALSPTEAHKAFRPKTLRKEALDMLSDLAVRRMAPRPGESSTLGRPRKVSAGRGAGGAANGSSASSSHLQQQRTRTQSFGTAFDASIASSLYSAQTDFEPLLPTELIASSQSSGRATSLGREESPLVDLADSTVSSSSLSSLASSANSVVERPGLRPRRPEFLELAGGGGGSSSNMHAPTWNLQKLSLGGSPAQQDAVWTDDGRSTDFASLPCEAASPDEDVDVVDGRGRSRAFSHRNPAYQSAHPACRAHGPGGPSAGLGGLAGRSVTKDPRVARGGGTTTEVALQESIPDVRGGEGRTGLLKWKGVVFTPEDDTDSVTSSPQDDTESQSTLEDSNGQVFTVELNRGWNSRLGFSLQSQGDDSVISAIYNDSVAAKNGRLKTGDRIIMVNDESVEGMPTADVIDLFRKIRGPIAITVWRENDR
ncbi:uncharacterized protein LOC117652626 [Thrips palmi]|uniref:Uncharacterized protein LOC117652626 n=1 Tax=Thrips palmi TaxID=161013 RepID=A0A6P9A8I3_THRPL|nr:uncharacterized protein LOC117652626 [Thrips palmi]